MPVAALLIHLSAPCPPMKSRMAVVLETVSMDEKRPLVSDVTEDGDVGTGRIYVLRSNPTIRRSRKTGMSSTRSV